MKTTIQLDQRAVANAIVQHLGMFGRIPFGAETETIFSMETESITETVEDKLVLRQRQVLCATVQVQDHATEPSAVESS